jgi:hypothetical protein
VVQHDINGGIAAGMGDAVNSFGDATAEINGYAKEAEAAIKNLIKPFMDLWKTLSEIKILVLPSLIFSVRLLNTLELLR